MALIGILRNKMGKIVVGAIMVTMVVFVMTDLIGRNELSPEQDDIAIFDGTSIPYIKFQNEVDRLTSTFMFNNKRNPNNDETDYIKEQAWNYFVIQYIYEPEFKKLGITVSGEEIVDMIQGNTITEEIKNYFRNPETNEFSKEYVTQFLHSIAQANNQVKASWIGFEQSLKPSRIVEKYENLISKTQYVTNFELNKEMESRASTVNIEYVYVPFLSDPDSLYSIQDSELQKYIDTHKPLFERPDFRNIKYVTFEIVPSQKDKAAIYAEILEIQKDLKESQNDSTYAAIYSDESPSFFTYNSSNEIPDFLKTEGILNEEGFTTDPLALIDGYELYKLSKIDEINADTTRYKVTKIKVKFVPSDETIDQVYSAANEFRSTVHSAIDFNNRAQQYGLKVESASNIRPNSYNVGSLPAARSIVSWVYEQDEEEAISDMIEMDNKYIIAILTYIQEKGIVSLDLVRNQVNNLVLNEKKVKKIEEGMLRNLEDFSAMAESFSGAKKDSVEVQLQNTNIAGVGYAPEAVGVVAALKEGESTRPIIMENGVIVVRLLNKVKNETPLDIESVRQQMTSKVISYGRTNISGFPLTYIPISILNPIDFSLQEKSEILDMRYKYF